MSKVIVAICSALVLAQFSGCDSREEPSAPPPLPIHVPVVTMSSRHASSVVTDLQIVFGTRTEHSNKGAVGGGTAGAVLGFLVPGSIIRRVITSGIGAAAGTAVGSTTDKDSTSVQFLAECNFRTKLDKQILFAVWREGVSFVPGSPERCQLLKNSDVVEVWEYSTFSDDVLVKREYRWQVGEQQGMLWP